MATQASINGDGWSVYDIVGLKLHKGRQRKSCSESELEGWIFAESRQHARGLYPLSYLQHAEQVNTVARSDLANSIISLTLSSAGMI